MKIDSIEDLEALADRLTSAVVAQNQAIQTQDEAIVALGALVERMDERIKLLTALLDSHHETLVKHGLAKGRPIQKTPQVN